MADKEIFDKVKNILVEEFEVEEDSISPESNLYTELELDSLDSVDLIVALENEFAFKINRAEDEEQLRAMRTIKDIIRFILSKSA